jgi:CubicO group peptidase (beta-lactamase class C family)
MRRVLLGLAVAVLVAIGGALAYAPYLPALVLEGFPTLTWSGRGSFADIAGPAVPLDLNIVAAARDVPLIPELAEPFTAKGGKALLVYRDSALVLEHYEGGVDETTPFNSFSMAKSLVGALVYRALADGRIASLDRPVSAYLPDDAGIADVTLRRLLTMQAGIHFDQESKLGAASGKDSDTTPNPFGPLARLHFQGLDAIETGLRVVTDEGDAFNYQNVNTALLGHILERVYARPLEQLLAEAIWQPAMASPAAWRRPTASLPVSAYCCIYATARDWIRVGIYLSSNGQPDRPFLPEHLWREFMGLDVPLAELQVDHYGAHIRQNVLDRKGQELQGAFTYLLGQGGQILYLMPQHGLVVYRAGENIPLLHSTLYSAWNSARPPAN